METQLFEAFIFKLILWFESFPSTNEILCACCTLPWRCFNRIKDETWDCVVDWTEISCKVQFNFMYFTFWTWFNELDITFFIELFWNQFFKCVDYSHILVLNLWLHYCNCFECIQNLPTFCNLYGMAVFIRIITRQFCLRMNIEITLS